MTAYAKAGSPSTKAERPVFGGPCGLDEAVGITRNPNAVVA